MGAGLHLGVVGVGRIGAFHAGTLRALPDVDALTVADADSGRAREVAADVEADVAETPEALVDAGIDALVIAAPTPAHVPLISLAASAGVPAFCEKPVALELDQLDGLIDEVERSGVLVQIGFQRRFDAGYRAARDAVADGRLGTLLVLRAATHDPEPPTEEYVAHSGGMFRDQHIHDFDAIRFVSGQEIAEVYADGTAREASWVERYGDIDTATAVLRLADGTLAVVTGIRHDALGYDVRLEVFGTRDSVAVGLDRRTPLHSVELGAPAVVEPYRDFVDRFEDAYRAELAAFVDAIRSGGPSESTLADARAALVAALAAGRSREERRPVSTKELTLEVTR